jgi:serine/threonine-protein kinase
MTDDPAVSRETIARASHSWNAVGDRESRDYLERRLTTFSQLMCWAFVALRTLEALLYRTEPQLKPNLYPAIFITGMVGLVIMAYFWRVVLVRGSLTIVTLSRIDAFYMIASGTVFGVTAIAAYDRHESAYTCLIYTCFVVFTRALIVPSSGVRTAVISSATFIPMVIAAIMLGEQELPRAAIVLGAITFSVVATALATIGSQIIYGLRQRVSEEMQLGQYTLDRKIGEGGMGVVYRARHALLRRPTALKLLHPRHIDPETLERFEREVQLMSQLTHPNTVAIFDYGHSPDGVFYYAMEYLDGIDLERLVRDYGAQPAARVIAVLLDVCGALQEAHTRGIVHRDIKPANVILCERGGRPDVAKVVDFGLVREIAGDSSTRILGTPAFIAPEAVLDPTRVSPAADLYAVGALAYFLISGRCVFEGDNALEVCRMHATETPTPPSAFARVEPQLEAVILQCLEKDHAKRPTSAAALAAALRAVPLAGDWNRSAVDAWWSEFRARNDSPASSPSLTTITIDLGARDV